MMIKLIEGPWINSDHVGAVYEELSESDNEIYCTHVCMVGMDGETYETAETPDALACRLIHGTSIAPEKPAP